MLFRSTMARRARTGEHGRVIKRGSGRSGRCLRERVGAGESGGAAWGIGELDSARGRSGRPSVGKESQGEGERARGASGLLGGLVRCQWSGGHPSGVRGRESDEGERGVSWQLGLPRSSPFLVSPAC